MPIKLRLWIKIDSQCLLISTNNNLARPESRIATLTKITWEICFLTDCQRSFQTMIVGRRWLLSRKWIYSSISSTLQKRIWKCWSRKLPASWIYSSHRSVNTLAPRSIGICTNHKTRVRRSIRSYPVFNAITARKTSTPKKTSWFHRKGRRCAIPAALRSSWAKWSTID